MGGLALIAWPEPPALPGACISLGWPHPGLARRFELGVQEASVCRNEFWTEQVGDGTPLALLPSATCILMCLQAWEPVSRIVPWSFVEPADSFFASQLHHLFLPHGWPLIVLDLDNHGPL